jgi:hypothetical protein
VIAILGEYDALPGLSQEAGVAERRPLPGSADGHGCGHNLVGSASLLAATAVKDFLAAHGIKGRVRYQYLRRLQAKGPGVRTSLHGNEGVILVSSSVKGGLRDPNQQLVG